MGLGHVQFFTWPALLGRTQKCKRDEETSSLHASIAPASMFLCHQGGLANARAYSSLLKQAGLSVGQVFWIFVLEFVQAAVLVLLVDPSCAGLHALLGEVGARPLPALRILALATQARFMQAR